MTSRRTLTSQELQEIYSAAPFTYDFEDILSWDSPFTLPITPPNIASLSYDALSDNATTIAKNVIQEIEATCPVSTPGFENYLNKHYSDIRQSHPDQVSQLYAQKKFLLLLYNKTHKQAIRNINLYLAEHIYTIGIDEAALHFENVVHFNRWRDQDFYMIEEDLYFLMSSITAAQIEIVLNRCLEKIKKGIRKPPAENHNNIKKQPQQRQSRQFHHLKIQLRNSAKLNINHNIN